MQLGHGGGRETFSSGFAVFFATLGSAVGLGNIWKFPYLTGKFGGGAFLLVYFLCVLFVALPVMFSEFYIGRRTRRNAVGAFKTLSPGTHWKGIGLMGVAASYLIMFFYSCVAGWVYYYLFRSIRGDFASITPEILKNEFGAIVTGTWTPVLWQWIVLIVVVAILNMGVKKGIERITKTLMPVLFLLIVICDIRALTLPGAGQGIDFLFHVDFAQLTPATILTAMGLAFFKLSLGMGTMITYASYFTPSNNMMATAVKVASADTLVSMLAGLAIIYGLGVLWLAQFTGWPGAVAEGYPNHATLHVDLPQATTICVKIAGVGSDHGALRVRVDRQRRGDRLHRRRAGGAGRPGLRQAEDR